MLLAPRAAEPLVDQLPLGRGGSAHPGAGGACCACVDGVTNACAMKDDPSIQVAMTVRGMTQSF